MSLEGFNSEAVPHTDAPQPKTDGFSNKEERDKARDKSFKNLYEKIKVSEDPSFFDELRNKFGSDYEACFYIAQSISKSVDQRLQAEYYATIRSILSFHERAEEISSAMNLAWFDFHYNEEPSKLSLILDTLDDNLDLPSGNEKLSLILSLLQSGYTSKSSNEEIQNATEEILMRRNSFKERTLIGKETSLIALEDESSCSSRNFTNLAEKLGSKTTIINEKTTESLRDSFCEEVGKSDPSMPLTLVLTVHGRAQDGGYIALPNDKRITHQDFAEALIKRGNAKNVTILTTQCFPRSSRKEDSFYDNIRDACLKNNIGVPAIYMESMENQPAIFNPRTNPNFDVFQTLRYVTVNAKDKDVLTGQDILEGSKKVIGNQPSFILPPTQESTIPLNNDLAFKDKEENTPTFA